MDVKEALAIVLELAEQNVVAENEHKACVIVDKLSSIIQHEKVIWHIKQIHNSEYSEPNETKW